MSLFENMVLKIENTSAQAGRWQNIVLYICSLKYIFMNYTDIMKCGFRISNSSFIRISA